jgi:putative hydrolase of the HAD superfamily
MTAPQSANSRANAHPGAIDTWIFDLDNTLYSAEGGFFDQISQRITRFVATTLNLDLAAALVVQKQLFHRYGTTMRGMMLEHKVDPLAYMEYCHDIDLSHLKANALMDQALARLPGRKLIHTNASVPHAERVLGLLGIERHFSGIFDIKAAEWLPKPDRSGYDLLVKRFEIDATRACMVEDMACNLKPAFESGMMTVWVKTGLAWASDEGYGAYIHHRTGDLGQWLGDWRGVK